MNTRINTSEPSTRAQVWFYIAMLVIVAAALIFSSTYRFPVVVAAPRSAYVAQEFVKMDCPEGWDDIINHLPNWGEVGHHAFRMHHCERAAERGTAPLVVLNIPAKGRHQAQLTNVYIPSTYTTPVPTEDVVLPPVVVIPPVVVTPPTQEPGGEIPGEDQPEGNAPANGNPGNVKDVGHAGEDPNGQGTMPQDNAGGNGNGEHGSQGQGGGKK
jgi:hypothetical protein